MSLTRFGRRVAARRYGAARRPSCWTGTSSNRARREFFAESDAGLRRTAAQPGGVECDVAGSGPPHSSIRPPVVPSTRTPCLPPTALPRLLAPRYRVFVPSPLHPPLRRSHLCPGAVPPLASDVRGRVRSLRGSRAGPNGRGGGYPRGPWKRLERARRTGRMNARPAGRNRARRGALERPDA